MKLIRTEDAVGHVLCHDITQIIKGVTKDAVFRKGHIVTEEDIPVLLSVGKENLYVWEKEVGMLHEMRSSASGNAFRRAFRIRHRSARLLSSCLVIYSSTDFGFSPQ